MEPGLSSPNRQPKFPIRSDRLAFSSKFHSIQQTPDKLSGVMADSMAMMRDVSAFSVARLNVDQASWVELTVIPSHTIKL
jgi:hypothetical protein